MRPGLTPRKAGVTRNTYPNIARYGGCLVRRSIMSDIITRVINVVSEQLSVDSSEIRADSSFVDDLGADSLDQVELIMAMEEEFDIKIDDNAAQKIKTVQNAVDFINSLPQ